MAEGLTRVDGNSFREDRWGERGRRGNSPVRMTATEIRVFVSAVVVYDPLNIAHRRVRRALAPGGRLLTS